MATERAHRLRLPALLAALLLVVAACSGSEDASDTVAEVTDAVPTEDLTTEDLPTEALPTEAPTSIEEGVEDAEAAVEDIDIVQALQDAGLTSVAAAVQTAGLEEELANLPAFTVFAPDDQAFVDFGADLESIDPAELQSVLAYHVIDQEIMSSDLEPGENTVTTLEGSELTVTVADDGTVTVGDGATVTNPDVEVGENGVVHVIDQVLQPSS